MQWIRITSVKLNFIADINIYQVIEKGMKRGVSYITQIYSKASNKYMEPHDKYKLMINVRISSSWSD